MKVVRFITWIISIGIILSVVTGCGRTDTKVNKDNNITSGPQEIVIDGQTFTEGVWIKKYPDNYACFKFETPKGFLIVSDPFHVNEKLQPDIVTESHQHLDHNDTSFLKDGYELITDPGEYQTDDVMINGYAGKHNRGDSEDTNNIFVIKLNDITIAHFASQGELPSDEVLEEIGTVDILLIQVFLNPDYGKLILEDVDAIISKLNPKIIIPEHGDSNMGDFLSEHLSVTEEYDEDGSMIITRAMLDENDTIRVINMDTY